MDGDETTLRGHETLNLPMTLISKLKGEPIQLKAYNRTLEGLANTYRELY